MKTILLFAISLCGLSGLALAADNNPSAEQAVRAAMEKFNAAARTGDQAALDKLLHPDIVYSHSSAKEETKAEAIAALMKNKANFVFQPGWTVKVYGSMAIVRAKSVANGTANGKPTVTPLSMLLVWTKVGNGWQMVGRQTTRVAP